VANRSESSGGAANRVSRFFVELEARHHEPLLARTSGTLRFDLTNGGDVESWLVTVTKGDIEVTRDGRQADVTLGLDRDLFAGMADGTVNAMALALRGGVRVEGDLGLAISFQRVFPGPPDAVGPITPAHRRGESR
jgi:putative sterol carrier protein